MKFVVQVAGRLLRAALVSCKKVLSDHGSGSVNNTNNKNKINFVDICVFCASIFLAVGYFYPWCLIMAFVCMLPPLQQQLYLSDEGNAGEKRNDMSIEEELRSKIEMEEQELVREMSHQGETNPSNDETDKSDDPQQEMSSPDNRKRKSKERKAKTDKPKASKDQWGLPTLRVRDNEGRIIEINSEKPVPIDTEYFKGSILIMLRTDGDLEKYNRYAHHFKGKQRKFEVQFQGQMKHVPQGEVMLGGELFEKMDISFVTRAFLSVLTKFCMSLNPFLHFSFGEERKENNMYELPHLTFPLFRVMDRVIVTPPGGELPELGKELMEDEQQRKDRRAGKGEHMNFREGYTYSFSFHSMYTDFSRWCICNFPGYKAIDIRGFFGQQHINVVCYEISEKDIMSTGKALHYNAHKRYLLTLELKHILCMSSEELAEAEREDIVGSESDNHVHDTDECDDSASVTSTTTTDGENGDDMDEESIAIALEMTDDQLDSQDLAFRDNLLPDAELLPQPDDSELIPGDSVVSLIAIPAPWEPWDQEKTLDEDLDNSKTSNRAEDQVNIPDALATNGKIPISPNMRSEGSRVMHGEATIHEDSGLSPKRTCFGMVDAGGVAIRRECNQLPAVRFIPVNPPHISTSRLARLSLRRNANANANSTVTTSSTPSRRKSVLSALYPRRRNASRADKHGSITPSTTAPTDELPPRDSHSGLRCGDAIQLQNVSTGRYLTVHKGWWLGWTTEEYKPSSSSKNNRIAAKVLFTIHAMDSTGMKYLPHGTPLVAGMAFRLRSVRWPDWEVGCCEPGRHAGEREAPIVLYYAKIKVRGHVPTTGPVKWHNSTRKVNPLCLSVMHEESSDHRGRALSCGSYDMMVTSTASHSTRAGTGFESQSVASSGAKKLFGVSSSRIIFSQSELTGIGRAKDETEANVSTGSILTQFLSLENDTDESQLSVKVSGWVEVLNRSLNYSQLAYIITVAYKPEGEGSQITKWTTLRTQEDLEEIFSQIEESKAHTDISEESTTNNLKDDDFEHKERKDTWSVVGKDEEERLTKGLDKAAASGVDRLASSDGYISPSTSTSTVRNRRDVLRRSRVNIQRHDIAPNHLYPADQNVLIMANRISNSLNGLNASSDAKTGQFGSSDSLASHGNKSQEEETRVKVERGSSGRSLDDGSGTQDKPTRTESPQNQQLASDASQPKGYLSDSSVNLAATQTSAPLDSGVKSSQKQDSQSSASPWLNAKKAFLSALSVPQILDTWFLSEDADKYLRAPAPAKKAPARQQVAVVARALWDSHWREEIAVVYPSYIAFYPLLTKKASWTLYLQELTGISHMADSASPLPGFSILRIETIGRLHYLAFSSKESCNVMAASVLEHFSEISFDSSMPSLSVGDPRDRFVLKSGRWRPAGRRFILNARKFLFDVEEKDHNPDSSTVDSLLPSTRVDFSEHGPEPYWKFAERLLKDVFQLELSSSCDADGLFPGRESVIKFLDETVLLKQINLQKDINFSSKEALCFFSNIYHTLLMHARLVLGLPASQDWSSFFDCVSYEIGSDVFSLSEIEHCVLGGRLARPHATPRHFPAVPLPNDDHYLYALPTADRRMRFLLNYGSISLLPTIYLLTPETMFDSLNDASIAFFESTMTVDMKRRTVTLPKICDIFRLDFGDDSLSVLRFILRYLNRDNWEKVSILLTGAKTPTVKFQDLRPRSHTRLHLVIQK